MALTVKHVHGDVGRVCVGRDARVVSRVPRDGVRDLELGHRGGWAALGHHPDARPAAGVVVDHAVIVVPENVHRWCARVGHHARQVDGVPALDVQVRALRDPCLGH